MTAERDAPHDPRAVLASACAALKIFPLPGVVLLPGAPAPFHLFEPRYRALGAAVLSGDRVLAVPTLVDPAEAMEARAAVRPIAGAGLVVAEQRNPDGTIDLVLRGEVRVRLLEELERGARPYHGVPGGHAGDDGGAFPYRGVPGGLAGDEGGALPGGLAGDDPAALPYHGVPGGHAGDDPAALPYREFRAELLHDIYPAGGAGPLMGDVEAVAQLVYELAGLLPPESGAGQLAEAVARMRVPGAMADLVAAAAISEPEARYRVLETLDVARRLAIVKEEIAGVILLLSRGRIPSA